MNTRRLERAFERRFDESTAAERRTVARQARDLAASETLEADRGHSLTVEELIGHLADAPDDCSLPERWNWWLGSLEVAYGGYRRFQIDAVPDSSNDASDSSMSADSNG